MNAKYWLQHLSLDNFRHFKQQSWEFVPGINVLHGDNGTGKTSVLEAIYLFATGRSFRGGQVRHLLRRGGAELSVTAHLQVDGAEQEAGVRFFVCSQGARRLCFSLSGEAVPLVDVSQRFPVQLLVPETFQRLEGGGVFRREFLNWGCFFGFPEFVEAWRRLMRALKQRNECLKSSTWDRYQVLALKAWDREFVQASELVDGVYRRYVMALLPHLRVALGQFLPQWALGFHFDYLPGWGESLGLLEALEAKKNKDRALGYTSVGPHRADIQVTLEGVPARYVLSRGQSKLFVCALLLARSSLLLEQTGRSCLMLMDDVGAELDEGALGRLVAGLVGQGQQQVLMTALSWPSLAAALAEHPVSAQTMV